MSFVDTIEKILVISGIGFLLIGVVNPYQGSMSLREIVSIGIGFSLLIIWAVREGIQSKRKNQGSNEEEI